MKIRVYPYFRREVPTCEANTDAVSASAGGNKHGGGGRNVVAGGAPGGLFKKLRSRSRSPSRSKSSDNLLDSEYEVSVLVSSWSDDEEEEEEETRKDDEETEEKMDEDKTKDEKEEKEKEDGDDIEGNDEHDKAAVEVEVVESCNEDRRDDGDDVIKVTDDAQCQQEEEAKATFVPLEITCAQTDDAEGVKKPMDDYNGNSVAELGVESRIDDDDIDVVTVVVQADNVEDNNDVAVPENNAGDSELVKSVDIDDNDVVDIVPKTTDDPTSVTSEPAIESEEDDIESSSLMSDLDWYQDYVQGRDQHRLSCQRVRV